MKKLCVLATLALSIQPAFANLKVIYGQDDRRDVYQTSNAAHLKLAKSTAGMIHLGMFAKGLTKTLFDLPNSNTLERVQNVCTSEKFSQQKLAPQCSGFLVGPDTLITAGHCYNSRNTPAQNCKNFAWVFDYDMKSATHDPSKNISINNIYLCKAVVAIQRDANYDFAIIKLDRKVVGRQPLTFRKSGKLSGSESLLVIGHPSGLPTKIAGNGRITRNDEPTRFSTSLDTFHGNSGSAVFNASTGQVEGILIMGKSDYQPSIPSNPNSCKVVNRCSDLGGNCTAGVESGAIARGEAVLRIELLASLISKALALK